MIFAQYKFSMSNVSLELHLFEKVFSIQNTFLVFLLIIFLIMIYIYINIGNVFMNDLYIPNINFMIYDPMILMHNKLIYGVISCLMKI